MNEERKKILEMLAAGTITADDADRLLDKLQAMDSPPQGETTAELKAPTNGPLKYLRVVVVSSDGDNVNVRVPLGLVRTGLKLSTMMPEGANAKLAERGIDLSHLADLQGEELIEELRDLQVDVDSSDGDTVRIFCE